MEELLGLSGISKQYGEHTVLKDVSFSLRRGEVHCLLGENGAGKSTLIKILSGAIAPGQGKIQINGVQYGSLTPQEAINQGIYTIYQDVELIESLTVADNIFLGIEKTDWLGFVDREKQNRLAREIVEKLHLKINEKSLVSDLSAAQKQMLQIAKAIHGDAKVLIMDEPTSSLGVEETKALMRMVSDLRTQGVGIIYISHYLEEVFQIGDRITILKDGIYMGTLDVAQTTVDEVIRKMVGREAKLFYERKLFPPQDGDLSIEHFTWRNAVIDVSLTIRKGEIFGLGGLVGAGRTELANAIVGAQKKDHGTVRLNGQEISIGSPRDALRHGIIMISENRKELGMFVDRSVLENMLVVHNELSKGQWLSGTKEKELGTKLWDQLHIAITDLDQRIGDLSGGNQQKVMVARALLGGGSTMIFDEPTKGVDIGARQDIYELIVELARKGNYIMVISSDMPELISLSDRIGVMWQGKLVETFNRGVSEETLMEYFLGGKVHGKHADSSL